ncbi:tetratricopeptide repeat protein [Marinobacteraceae bacterium S3BR75-40.1]
MASLRYRLATLGLAIAVLSGCQSLGMAPMWGPSEPVDQRETLANLQPATLEASETPSGPVPLQEVIDSYSELVPLLQDPETQIRVQHRLADLKFMQGENRMVEQAVDDLDVAIQAYRALLEKYPDRPDNDRVYYQLAKAYDLKGATEQHLATLNTLVERYPNSPYWVEAQFRRGEILFTLSRYADAQAAFEAVIERARPGTRDEAFVVNAHYMTGWCQFKRGRYQPALLSYTQVLDRVMPQGQGVDDVEARHRTLVEDLFRVIGLSLSYLGGADALEALFAETGPKPYEVVVYDRYGKLLLEKEQYSDAIDVYERFIALHPQSPWAPRYHMRTIDTLRRAGFLQEIPARKAAFIRQYGIASAYWPVADDATRDYIRIQLETLLPEMADRHYVKAQRARGEQRRDHYRQAASYYAEFAQTFPDHPKTTDMLFLLGETRNALADWKGAIEAFERVAYDFGAHEKAAEAAYASILAYRQYAQSWSQLPVEQAARLRAQQQQSRLRFVKTFPQDPRALDVLYVATQYAYERKDYAAVVAQAQQMIDWQPAPPRDLLLEARLLKAHSLYAQADYLRAEQAYKQALAILPPKDKRYDGLVENLAACVYKQAEAYLAAGQKRQAVDEFLRVGQAAPTSKLQANAEYDAANLLIDLKDWDRAIAVLRAFRRDYPGHPMIDTLPPKLALAYRETEQWEAAADELRRMVELADTEEEKRQNLLIAADLYDRAENYEKARVAYRKYANTYPEPRDQYMETANRLAEIYKLQDKPLKRRFWLAKQMKTVDQHPDEADDRMRYLAASASAVLARDALQRYRSIELTLPLTRTMKAKTAALQKAIEAYKKTASYGISSFSTEAGYQMADLYAQLARDLMDSERPEGLSELELSQYELLLEEQSYPFEDNAIDIHEQNASRAWNGIYDEWVKRSYDALKRLLPARYNKPEIAREVVDELD